MANAIARPASLFGHLGQLLGIGGRGSSVVQNVIRSRWNRAQSLRKAVTPPRIVPFDKAKTMTMPPGIAAKPRSTGVAATPPAAQPKPTGINAVQPRGLEPHVRARMEAPGYNPRDYISKHELMFFSRNPSTRAAVARPQAGVELPSKLTYDDVFGFKPEDPRSLAATIPEVKGIRPKPKPEVFSPHQVLNRSALQPITQF